MIGSDEINAYSVWIHVDVRGQRPLSGLHMSEEAAQNSMKMWEERLKSPAMLDTIIKRGPWTEEWCGRGQVVVRGRVES
jgi:hypothetical protein